MSDKVQYKNHLDVLRDIEVHSREIIRLRKILKDICPHNNVEKTEDYTDDYGSYIPDGTLSYGCTVCGAYSIIGTGLYSKEGERTELFNNLEQLYYQQQKKEGF